MNKLLTEENCDEYYNHISESLIDLSEFITDFEIEFGEKNIGYIKKGVVALIDEFDSPILSVV